MYDWITDAVAIGDYQTPNSLFDVIVDVNYPNNHTIENQIGVLGNVISAGIPDKVSFPIEPIAERILCILKATPHRKILFRCYAGVSRSVTIAALYLSSMLSIPRIDALTLIQSKRPQAKPNEGFQLIFKN